MKLMILDGNSIVNRAFYGVRPLSAPDGTPTNAVYGFLAILQRMLDEQEPEAVCVSFDLKAPTFRHKACNFYKAQRKPMPEELAVQMPLLKETLDAMGIRRYEIEGFEADDILGTAAAVCERSGWDCVVVTGDKDSLQLVSETTSVCNVKTVRGQTETILYTPESFRAEYGFAPAQMVDLKALMGDSSDNIPGVPGIGEKTALDLVRRYGTVDKIYSSLAALDIKDGVRKKLTEGEASARQSYWLATIVRDVPLHFCPEENIWNNSYTPELYGVMKRLGFKRFIDKWGLTESETAPAEAEASKKLIEQVISDEAGMDALIAAVKRAEHIAVVPTDGLDAVEICDGETVYRAQWSVAGEKYNELLRVVFSTEVKKLGHNIKDLMGLLIKDNLPVEGFEFDTALAAYLLDANDGDYSLPRISAKYLSRELDGAQAIFELHSVLGSELDELGMAKLYYEVELPLCRVLADMEVSGFYVDRKALYDFGESLNDGIAQLQAGIWAHAGHEFNINSPKQLGEVLFEELMLPSGKKTKSGWSTNADVLEKLRDKHPIIGEILEYRMLTKLKSTYADGLLKVIAPDGRIHTNFQMTVTATGRLSSTEPNLQNIPVRRKLGAQIRKMFVASPGKVLVDADYSQIELRVLAHIADDKRMQEAFTSGTDIHTATAAQVFGVAPENVTPLMRRHAKAVNFGIVYGISAFSLSEDIGVSVPEAKAYIESYLRNYEGVRDYMKRIVEQAKRDGYVTTLLGRRRELPELKSSNFNIRSFGERVALNTPIQGTAADIIKIAMIRVDNALRRKKLCARLILQVHDELIVECPMEEQQTVAELVKYEMEHVMQLHVPLLAEAKCGASWYEAK